MTDPSDPPPSSPFTRAACDIARPERILDDEVEQRLVSALAVLHLLAEDVRKRRSAFLPRVQEALVHVAEALKAQRAAHGQGGSVGAPSRPTDVEG